MTTPADDGYQIGRKMPDARWQLSDDELHRAQVIFSYEHHNVRLYFAGGIPDRLLAAKPGDRITWAGCARPTAVQAVDINAACITCTNWPRPVR